MIHRLRILEGPRAGEVLPLSEGAAVAGREPDCDLYLPSRRVSRKHCRFTLESDRCVAEDLGSANGMLINGHPMEACELVPGTHIQMGDALMVYEQGNAETTRPLPEEPSDPTMESMSPPPMVQHQVVASGPTLMDDGAPLGGFGGGPAPEPYQAPPPTAPMHEPAPAPAADPLPFGAPPAGGGFGAPPAGPAFGAAPAGPVAQGPQAEPGPTPSPEGAPSGGFLSSKTPFMFRVVALFAFLGLVLLCGPGGGFIALATGGADALEQMSIERGVVVAESLGNRNAESLRERGLDYDLVGTERLDEVDLVYILDDQGSVVAPINLAAKSLSDDPLFQSAKKDRSSAVQPGEGEITRILVPIRGAATKGAPASTVLGYAYIEYNAGLAAAAVASPMTRLGISAVFLLFTFVAGVAGVWVLAERPLAKVQEEAELAIKGHSSSLTSPVKWGRLEALVHTLNRALARAAGRPDPNPPAPEKVVETVVEKVVETVVEKVVEPDGRMPTLLSACTFPVVLLDAQGCVVDANAWGQHLLGQGLEGLQGQRLTDLVHPPARDRLEVLWQGIASGQEPVLADNIDFGEGARACTLAAGPGVAHAVLVIQ